MALNIMEAKSPPESQQKEAKWWSQNGLDQLRMGMWNYWPGGSLGNPPTSQNSSSTLTILTLPRKWRLHGSSPSLPVAMEVSTPLLKRPDVSTIQQQLWKYIDTAILRMSKLDSTQSLTKYQMPSPLSETSSMGVNITWSGPIYPSFYSTSRIRIPLPPPL
jgi:hypothetical protein